VERVIQARDVAADSLRETRAMIAALQPSDLDGGSLVDALGRLAESASGETEETEETGETGDGLTVSVESGDGAVELPIAVEAVLLRVAQSAVANVRQHAGASRALITLSTNPEAVRLDIVDDGSGFDLAAVQATLAEARGGGAYRAGHDAAPGGGAGRHAGRGERGRVRHGGRGGGSASPRDTPPRYTGNCRMGEK
jgi:signal transduction histidine kinase